MLPSQGASGKRRRTRGMAALACSLDPFGIASRVEGKDKKGEQKTGDER